MTDTSGRWQVYLCSRETSRLALMRDGRHLQVDMNDVISLVASRRLDRRTQPRDQRGGTAQGVPTKVETGRRHGGRNRGVEEHSTGLRFLSAYTGGSSSEEARV